MSVRRVYTITSQTKFWVKKFNQLVPLITKIFNKEILDFQHVGSTSVSGLAGKPTLDVLVIIKDIAKIDKFNNEMKKLGFDALGEYVAPHGRQFKKDRNGARVVNIHFFESTHPKAEQMLVMRDYLRSYATEAKKYAELKNELFKKYPQDYTAYRQGKNDFLESMEKKARSWKRQILKQFQIIPGVGKSIAEDLWDMGFRSIKDLKNKNPEKLYKDFCNLKGMHIDRCMLYALRCAVYFVSHTTHDPKKLKWWNWKD
jgi:GrpB-like predicted nucleotidyltransferase (UPF0157 family)